MLGRADPLAPDLDDLARVGGPELVVEQPPADAVAGLEHDGRVAGGEHVARGRQAREPGADDGDVDVAHAAAASRRSSSIPSARDLTGS